MEPEEKKLLEKTLEVSEENNKILKEIEKGARWSRIFTVVRIVIFVLPFVLAILYFLPFLRVLNDFYSDFGASGSGTSTEGFSDLLRGLRERL